MCYNKKRNKVSLQRIGGWPFDIQRAFFLGCRLGRRFCCAEVSAGDPRPLEQGGDAVEQETFIIILMILVIGYIISIKK